MWPSTRPKTDRELLALFEAAGDNDVRASTMLRDLIYSAWLQSKLLQAPAAPNAVTLRAR